VNFLVIEKSLGCFVARCKSYFLDFSLHLFEIRFSSAGHISNLLKKAEEL